MKPLIASLSFLDMLQPQAVATVIEKAANAVR